MALPKAVIGFTPLAVPGQEEAKLVDWLWVLRVEVGCPGEVRLRLWQFSRLAAEEPPLIVQMRLTRAELDGLVVLRNRLLPLPLKGEDLATDHMPQRRGGMQLANHVGVCQRLVITLGVAVDSCPLK